MSVRVRLKHIGTRNVNCFRVVVMDQRSSRDGKAIEEIGFYDPLAKVERLDMERAEYWKGVGASFSETAVAIYERLKKGVVLKDLPRAAKPSKKAVAKAQAEAEAKAAAEAEAAAAKEAASKAAEAPKAE